MTCECLDLFTPVVPEEQFHPNFRKICSSVNYKVQRECLKNWTRGFVDRDNKIVKEFQTTFNSTFWEFYLFDLFKEYEFNVKFCPSPDFIIDNGQEKISVEAVIAGNAQSKTPEWETEKSFDYYLSRITDNLFEYNKEAIIRFSNAISEKVKKFRNIYSKNREIDENPFVIALAPFHSPFFFMCADVPIRALLYDYYVDEEAYKKDPLKYSKENPPTKHLKTVKKNEDTDISLGLFNSDIMSEISAVIYNPIANLGKVSTLCKDNLTTHQYYYRTGMSSGKVFSDLFSRNDFTESIFTGLQIYHNPYAKHPINPNFFQHSEVIQCMGYLGKDKLIYDKYDNMVMGRFIIGLSENYID